MSGNSLVYFADDENISSVCLGTMKLVLTGVTGHLGSRVLSSILERKLIPASDLIVSSSHPENVSQSAREQRIAIRHGDFTSPASLADSFKGAEALFLVSFPSPSIERWENHRNAIDAAKAAGIHTVIYTSLMFGGEDGMKSIAVVQQAHIRTIEYLRDSGLKYVVIREGIYAESWWLYAGFQPRNGYSRAEEPKGDQGIEWVIPNDGPVAWVSWDELGEATARILSEYQKYEGQTLNLTGSKAITISDLAKLVERETGRHVDVKLAGPGGAAKYQKEREAAAEWVIDAWSTFHDALGVGETSIVDPLLEQLNGRKPRTVDEMARQLFVHTA